VYDTRPDYPFEADRIWSNIASVWDVFNEYNKHYDIGDFWSGSIKLMPTRFMATM
jgi:hypothetical protein